MTRRVGAFLLLVVSLGSGCAAHYEEGSDDEADWAEQTASTGMRDASAASIPDAGADGSAADAGRASADAGATGCAALTYEAFGKAFLQTYCVGCHAGPRAPDGVDLSTLAGVKANKSEVVAHAVRTPRSKPMPPPSSRQPTAAERARLGEWLSCGPN